MDAKKIKLLEEELAKSRNSTFYVCETLKENVQLASENSMLRVQNRELLARCDLLEAELAALEDQP